MSKDRLTNQKELHALISERLEKKENLERKLGVMRKAGLLKMIHVGMVDFVGF